MRPARHNHPQTTIANRLGSKAKTVEAGLFAQTNTGQLLSTTRAYNPANGKSLNVDPIREQGGINLTGYVGGSPMMGIDPVGLIGKVSVIGGDVIIELPIEFYGPGLTPAVQEKFIKAINGIWSGISIYGYNINLKVTEPSFWDKYVTGNYNKVRVDPAGTRYPTGDGNLYQAAALCSTLNGSKTAMLGTWAADLTPKQAAHEAGHFLGLGEINHDEHGMPTDPSGIGNLMNNLPGHIGLSWIQLRQILMLHSVAY